MTNRVPFPPDKGDKIRTFHQLDHLASSHDVYCACFVEGRGDRSHVETLRRWCVDVLAVEWSRGRGTIRAARGWLGGAPLTTSAYWNARMSAGLARWGKAVEFDAAVAFSVSMAPYLKEARAPRRVLDLCDVDSQKWLDYARARRPASLIYRAEGARLRTYERACLKEFDATILITDRERRVLDPQGRCSTVHVIPNGTTLRAEPATPASACGPVVGFVGVMDYRPNVEGMCWFAREVWPRVLCEVPDARLMIVGRHPTWAVRRLAKLCRVDVTGEVDSPEQYLSHFRAVVAPLRIARGMQNKVLEAMTMRRPVVATSAVAGGLHVEAGHNILVADEAERFAEQVVALCRYDGLCDKIGVGGYRCAATYYSWAETMERFERLVVGREMPDVVRGSAHRETIGRTAGSPKAAGAARPRSPYAAMLRGDVVDRNGERSGGEE